MRVLLSAYSCEPNRGSEPEVGWQRALHMLGHADEVWVLTRSNNKSVIEADPLSHNTGLHFIYYDLPWWALRLKKQFWFRPVYFILWQMGAYRLAAMQHSGKPFDRVYHVTFASMEFGSFMGRLGIPFIIGPVAGGERAPFRLRHSMPMRGKASEFLRDLGILLQRYSPLARMAYAGAKSIYVATPASLCLVPSKWHSKTAVHLAVATNGHAGQGDRWHPPDTPRFVYAGNLLHLKGLHLAIRALAQVRCVLPKAAITLIGDGPAEQWLRAVAKQCCVTEAVEFAGRISREKLIDEFQSYTSLVFPSLHDSGGMAVLEALSVGLPVICLDLGGPGVIVNESCGTAIPTSGASEDEVIGKIARAMISLGTMSSVELRRLSQGAIARANELSWVKQTERIVLC